VDQRDPQGLAGLAVEGQVCCIQENKENKDRNQRRVALVAKLTVDGWILAF
jgi:hypothetical protein